MIPTHNLCNNITHNRGYSLHTCRMREVGPSTHHLPVVSVFPPESGPESVVEGRLSFHGLFPLQPTWKIIKACLQHDHIAPVNISWVDLIPAQSQTRSLSSVCSPVKHPFSLQCWIYSPLSWVFVAHSHPSANAVQALSSALSAFQIADRGHSATSTCHVQQLNKTMRNKQPNENNPRMNYMDGTNPEWSRCCTLRSHSSGCYRPMNYTHSQALRDILLGSTLLLAQHIL